MVDIHIKSGKNNIRKDDIVELICDFKDLKAGTYFVNTHTYLGFTIAYLTSSGIKTEAFLQPHISLAAFKNNFKCELLTNSKELYL